MEYSTRGKEIYPELSLPLVCASEPILPAPDDGYYALVCADRGFITVAERTVSREFPAPAALFVRPGHSACRVSVQGSAHCLVFRPEAINTTIFTSSPGRPLSELSEFFFFAPFTALPDSGYAVRPLDASLYASVSSLAGRLDDALNANQGALWPCMSRSFFLELLILLERSAHFSPLEPAFEASLAGDPVEKIREYVNARYATRLTLDSLAARFATNRTTLNKRFNELYGMSVMAYVASVRIVIASSLLRNTELPLSEIAARTGFADESWFSRAFKKAYGVSPGAFRKSCPNPYS